MSRRITIEIVNKIATCLSETPVVCGNSDYEVEFLFDEEWAAHEVKTAMFIVNGKNTKQVFSGNVCKLPVVQGTLILWVGVFSGAIDDGTLSTTTPALVRCVPCITDGGDIPAPPPEDVYSQIIELLNKYIGNGENSGNGVEGVNGVGIKNITIDENGNLIITLTNNEVVDLGKIKVAEEDVERLIGEYVDDEIEGICSRLDELEDGYESVKGDINTITEETIPAINESIEKMGEEIDNIASGAGNIGNAAQGQYELLEEITTEEELTQYEYIPKNNGKKNLKAVFIRLIIPKGNGTGLVNTVIYYNTWYSTTIASTNMISGSSKRYFNVEGHNSYGKIQGIFWGGDNEYSANRYSPASLPTFTKSNFDKISLKAMTSGVPFPIGTNIKIYGVEE